jgi:hypothetical protein
MIPSCTKCRKPRVEVSIDQVPQQKRPGFDKMCEELTGAGMQISQVVYCKTCDEYSVLSGWNAF